MVDFQTEFLQLLFTDMEWVVITDDPKGVKSFKGPNRPPGVYFGLNPVYPSTTRKNSNVSQFRHFLVEFDEGTTDEQLEMMEKSGIPYLTAVFSGNKSVHFIIALDHDLPNSTWKQLLLRIHLALPAADSACKAGCQLTRLPKSGEYLIRRGRKTNFEELDDVLPKLPEKSKIREGACSTISAKLTRRTMTYLSANSHKSRGHADSLHAAKNLLEIGMSKEEVLNTLIQCRRQYCPDQTDAQIRHRASQALNWVLAEWNNTL